MNAIESTYTEWRTERKDLKNEIDHLKKVNDERVKESENMGRLWGVREEVSRYKKSLESLLERMYKRNMISSWWYRNKE